MTQFVTNVFTNVFFSLKNTQFDSNLFIFQKSILQPLYSAQVGKNVIPQEFYTQRDTWIRNEMTSFLLFFNLVCLGNYYNSLINSKHTCDFQLTVLNSLFRWTGHENANLNLSEKQPAKEYRLIWPHSEAATEGVLLKNVFLKILQNSQENTCARVSFLIKLKAWGLQLY